MSLTRQPYHRGFKSRRAPLRDWRTRPKEGTRARLTRELDSLVSQTVRKRDGYRCVICGGRSQPKAARVFSRPHFAARWDLENLWTNCDFCKRRHNESPEPYLFWFVNRL